MVINSMKNIKYVVMGIMTGLLVVVPMACGVANPCSSYLEQAKSVSDNDDIDEASWCLGLCEAKGKDHDRVEREDFPIGDGLHCFCCE